MSIYIFIFWEGCLKCFPASPLVWQTSGPEGFAGAESHVRWCAETVCLCECVRVFPSRWGNRFMLPPSSPSYTMTLTNKRREACRFHLLVSSSFSSSLRLTLTSTHSHRRDAITVNEKRQWKCKKKNKTLKWQRLVLCQHKASKLTPEFSKHKKLKLFLLKEIKKNS